MPDEIDFQVGDRVVIREWEDMVAEFGTDSDGDIPTPGLYFVRSMRELCGMHVTISEIYDVGPDKKLVSFKEGRVCHGLSRFNFTFEMIRHVAWDEVEAPAELPEEEFVSLLFETP